MQTVDLAIVGSGFGGALLAMVARRLGLSVALLERGTHPRFAIGESTSPLTNLLLEQLAERYDLPRLLPLTTYGAWQRTYPEIGCGLKRGFTYFYHREGEPYRPAPDRSNQLLVAASPSDNVSDTHWFRADVDHFLVQEAIALGVDYRDRTLLQNVHWDAEGSALLTGERLGAPLQIRARLVIDATGPRGFLSRALDLPAVGFCGYPPTQTLYSHFTDVARCDAMEEYAVAETPPYPFDDAALHHVFDAGWMWVLRFGNGVTSAGIAVTDAYAAELGLSEGAPAWPRFLARYPTVAAQFAQAKTVQPFVFAPRLSYRCATAAGEGWAMLPSAAAFIDPLFSTGIPLTLLGIERLGRILETCWGQETLNARLAEYGAQTLAEADWTARFIAAGYATFPTFSRFTALSLFYFAAASFSEMARRLDRSHLVRRFLAGDHAVFAPGMARCMAEAHRRPPEALTEADFAQEVRGAIACLNIAGLSDPAKQNWYGIDLEDVVRGAEKLEWTPDTLRPVLATAPWAQA